MDHNEALQQAELMGEQMGPIDTQSAMWANNVLPELRRLAGYDDPMGVGTYATPTDDEAPYRLDELVDAFETGALEAV